MLVVSVAQVAVDDFDEEKMETLVGPAFDAGSEEVPGRMHRVTQFLTFRAYAVLDIQILLKYLEDASFSHAES